MHLALAIVRAAFIRLEPSPPSVEADPPTKPEKTGRAEPPAPTLETPPVDKKPEASNPRPDTRHPNILLLTLHFRMRGRKILAARSACAS